MNWLLIIIVIGLIGSAIDGYHKGFIRIAFSLASLIVTIVLVGFLTPYVSDYIQNQTGIYTSIEKTCAKKIEQAAHEKVDAQPKNEKEVIEYSGIKLPKILEKQLMLGMEDKDGEGRTYYDKAAGSLANIIVGGIAFFITLFIVIFVLRIIEGLLGIVTKLPLLKGLNRLAGIIAGVAKEFIMVWLLAFLLALFCTNPIGQELLTMVEDSRFLTFLYEHNGVIIILSQVL